ncbi:MAG TPA: hypothetical protein VMS43_10760 [Allosphingosinicella sp.]|nr:hypothetical protein [Allosphingosinicella sp.]
MRLGLQGVVGSNISLENITEAILTAAGRHPPDMMGLQSPPGQPAVPANGLGIPELL